MTIEPVNDLIVDVMAAADPAAQRIAASRLERMASDHSFVATVDQLADQAATIGRAATAGADLPARSTTAEIAGRASIVDKAGGDRAVYRKFEAFVLQMFVESMLPKNADDLFGKGTAGSVWRSMLAEQIGNEMARGNGIGIAKQLAGKPSSTEPAAADS
ncbi:rod-binding protein [Rhodopseudomonas sp. NSM]|uniref:rod-binding protein n=1 Tax=Rhodopseudomonas sp. NSM TaxID=3457630 RepID=UPI004034FAB0